MTAMASTATTATPAITLVRSEPDERAWATARAACFFFRALRSAPPTATRVASQTKKKLRERSRFRVAWLAAHAFAGRDLGAFVEAPALRRDGSGRVLLLMCGQGLGRHDPESDGQQQRETGDGERGFEAERVGQHTGA